MELSSCLAKRIFGNTARPLLAPRNEYTYLPTLGYFGRPFSLAKNFPTDRHGLISNGYDVQRDLTRKDPNEFRVFVLGGSTVAGTCVDDVQHHLAARLEKMLQTRFDERNIPLKVKAINAGVSGYFSFHEVTLARFGLTKLQPDLLIFFDGANDFHNWVGPDKWKGTGILPLFDGNYDYYAANAFHAFDSLFTFRGLMGQFYQWSTMHFSTSWLFENERRRFENKIDKELAVEPQQVILG